MKAAAWCEANNLLWSSTVAKGWRYLHDDRCGLKLPCLVFTSRRFTTRVERCKTVDDVHTRTDIEKERETANLADKR